ncbi:MAG: hypothetical protein PHW60_06305 [Kiritimatiellae bacterium]|nr:hypothetical protein [Kiritimatiellia bacterium]
MSYLPPEPPQPSETAWKFIAELSSPLWTRIDWTPRAVRNNEAGFGQGATVERGFAGEGDRLDTAYADLDRFLAAAGVSRAGPFRIRTGRMATPLRETYRVIVTPEGCDILAAGPEGIRRGIFFVEDQMLRAGGPFLPLGKVERRPVIRTRISRCFFGPIHRPPKNRDELTDNVDYYPDEYLNRLAHEGINGLWLTIHFSEICAQAAIPEYGRDPKQRLDKLRRTVERCARYGIRIYTCCCEPQPIYSDSPAAKAHPELLGHSWQGNKRHYFCTSNPTAMAYLEEVMYNLFAAAPGLGGIINISIGEGGSHCYSGAPWGINCPRCKNRSPYDVLNDTVAAMARGMHTADPAAECISWPYGQYWSWGDAMTAESAGRLPPGIILQHNFESSAIGEQCGRKIRIFDYWLSFIGPSRLFTDCAKAAVKNGNRMFAKLQVGCSHEVATAPFVPVPGHLYRKYKIMHELGVSGVMQCWYFGNYPGIMNKSAGELAFAPFPKTEGTFLLSMARRDWGDDAKNVVRAWKLFQRGYSHFPLNQMFGWYGPLHDAPTWPLHLEPADKIIAPSWEIASYQTRKPYPASGDRIGECFYYTHTLDEIILLCGEMSRHWNRGVDILKKMLPRYAHNEERRRDIGVATALGIQFESAANIMRFYAMREELPWKPQAEQKKLLAAMKRIVKRELTRDAELLELSKADSRLGFHSEAEGYKYFPAKIEWRMLQLRRLLNAEFPQAVRRIRRGEALWPEYTGQQPQGPTYGSRHVNAAPPLDGKYTGPVWDGLPEVELQVRGGKHADASQDTSGVKTSWKACHNDQALYFAVRCVLADPAKPDAFPGESVKLLIEPRRLWPCQWYIVNTDGSVSASEAYNLGGDNAWTAAVQRAGSEWSTTVRIPFSRLRPSGAPVRPMRVDLERRVALPGGNIMFSWMERHPLESRLAHGSTNPADFGWLIPG